MTTQEQVIRAAIERSFNAPEVAYKAAKQRLTNMSPEARDEVLANPWQLRKTLPRDVKVLPFERRWILNQLLVEHYYTR